MLRTGCGPFISLGGGAERSKLTTLRPRCQEYSPASISWRMDEDQISQILSEIGRRGGYARAKRLSAERRKEIATKASKAAAKARTKKAKQKAK